MWTFVVFVALISWCGGHERSGGYERSARQQQQQQQQGPGWDIRLAVPGDPGNDYPTLGNIPRTSFSCSGKAPGYYADLETNCQAFRVCTSGSTYGFQSFLCPNGTLFNQAVVVCDWWMNVNCQKSGDFISSNNDKFGNLRLGPQLMKDVKKMITHPMRNPYDKTIMKSNLIVMQDYKPPANQMFGALLQGGLRSPNSVYVPAKQIQQPYYSNNAIAASTLSPSYVPPAFNSIPSRDAEVFQRQRQNGQYRQSGKLQQHPSSQISNGHAAQFTQNQNSAVSYNNFNSYSRPTQTFTNQAQYRQQQNTGNAQTFNQRGQYRQSGQYTDGRNQAQSNGKLTEYGVSYQKQQYNNAVLNANTGHINHEAKENLVSGETPATIVTKTLTFNRIVDPEPGKPKSRITIKTWLVKPTKAAKLIAEPTAYNYARPTNPTPARQVAAATPYNYNPPTTAQSARIIAQPEGPYSYNKPTTAAKQVEAPYTYNRPTPAAKQVEGPYVYNRPTAAAKQVVAPPRPPSRQYLTPTSPPPTLSRLYLNPTTAPPTLPSRLYIPPTTYKPAAKLYIPPSQSANLIVSKQYLAPSAIQQPAYYQSEKLQASPTSPTPVYASPNDNPSYSVTKHSHIKSNRNNLTFSDILTKEKLDITVNDIVSETDSILKTASPIQQFGQYRQEDKDYSEESYIQSENESDERLTPQTPTVVATSSRLVQGPATDLEPPVETYDSNQNVVNTNRLATLPFYKEPGSGTNTIERTVSLKISIPEKVASYLFKSRNESDYDKLEILNTGSSNYLVLTNNVAPKVDSGANFIPIGRLIADKSTNISDSQALVFNFLADSLNAAKEYSNIAKQNIVPSTPAQFQAVNDQQLARITNQISQLTASQYSGNQNNYNHGNVVSSTQTGGGNQYQSAKYTNGYTQNQQQINSAPARLTSQQGYAYQSPNNGFSGNLQINPNQNIYSGQLYKLPVPDVTNHIYNAGSANLVQGQNQYSSNQNGNVRNQQSSAEVEIVHSHTLPISAPAKLQQFTPNEPETFNNHENSGSFGGFLSNSNGISAQLQDKIVGTIPHPSEDNKYVTYEKDQSYYIHTKLNNNVVQNTQSNNLQTGGQSAKIIQGNSPNLVFQFVPSVSYQLEDEKEQQKILNAFQIDEYGSPKKLNQVHDNRRQDFISEVDYAVEHPLQSQAAKLVDGQFNEVNTLYAGPSSYSAPQASVGSLEANELHQNPNARLEQLEETGYRREAPANQFSF
ncbi:chitin binding peritrophin-A domain-containing protein [Phthorimaea operculella]|nr:chitin binding peritrophin-A domain-containing protein [Phthorimaea operculella]